MGINGIFNQTVSLLERSLDLRSMKHKSIVSNVANIDTPNYKAFDVMVEDELQRLNRTTGAGADIQMATPRENHIAPRQTAAVRVNRHITQKTIFRLNAGTAIPLTWMGKWPPWQKTASCTPSLPR